VRLRYLLAGALIGLSGCGGGGDGAGLPGPTSKVFVADSGNRAIGSVIDPNPPPGTAVVDRIIIGPGTGLGMAAGGSHIGAIPSLALDPAADRLYVATDRNVVLVFDNAGHLDGDVVRSREISGRVTRGTNVVGVLIRNIFLDTLNNRLYATDSPTGEVHVFEGASTLNGEVPVTRTIKPDVGVPCCVTTFGVAVDAARNMLYVGVVTAPSNSRIIVFDNASTIDTGTGTSLAPNRTLTFGEASSFFLDAMNNRLYVALAGGGIHVFDNASSLTAGATADRSFQLGNTPKYIFVDPANNRLYGVSENLVFIVNNLTAVNGPGQLATVIAVQTTGSLFSAVAVKP
jgi:hypothetical protein